MLENSINLSNKEENISEIKNNIEKNDILHKNISSSYNSAFNNPIVAQLIEFGFNPIYSSRIFLYYHPRTIEEALDYLDINNGIIQHLFIQEKVNINNEICFLCGEKKEIHLNKDENSYDINISFKIKEDINESQKKECEICSNPYISNSDNTLNGCGHSFCNDCWYNFLSIKIRENKISSIKCLDYECQEKLSDNFINKIINSNEELIKKYKKFKLEKEIINNPNKKFCPIPNCDSYLELKNNNKKVKCLNGHILCFNCLKEPHEGTSCNNILDNSLIEFSKNHLIKKCPNCSIITEKIEGCNHITCSKCNYQWCWFCNKEYSPTHFLEGKCKGYQFFRPKNENDIKLAFEGKIILNLSQRQIDTLDELELDRGRNRNRNNILIQPRYYYLFKCGKFTRCFLLLIYILFGQDLIILNIMEEYGNFPIVGIILFYLPYKIAFCFYQIYFNVINLIPYLVKEGFMNFTSLIYDAVIFKRKYKNLKNYFFRIILLFFVSFCYSIFICLHFGANKIKFLRTEFSLIMLVFIYVIFTIIFFSLSIYS